MTTAYILGGALALIMIWLVGKSIRRKKRRAYLRQQPFPPEWTAILDGDMPLYGQLPSALRNELNQHIMIFLDEKNFEGCGGLEMTDEIRVTIAAQACLLLLGRKANYYPKLSSIVVYPHTITRAGYSQMGGVVVGGEVSILGESWDSGTVVLSWDSVLGGAMNIADGRNVTMHEFAHQLDQESGATDGTPKLDRFVAYIPWAKTLGREFARMQKKKGRSVMDRYGATNPAEFFAVATETFIEKPRQMKRRHPELYEELKSYFKFDPIEWGERDKKD
jgi:MtfA peptidase